MATGKIVILITTSDEAEAQKIAGVLINSRKAACVNIVPAVNSTYWWRGNIENAREILLVVKSRESELDEIIRLVRENHSYEVPEVIALPVIGGNPDYLEWIDSEVGEQNALD